MEISDILSRWYALNSGVINKKEEEREETFARCEICENAGNIEYFTDLLISEFHIRTSHGLPPFSNVVMIHPKYPCKSSSTLLQSS